MHTLHLALTVLYMLCLAGALTLTVLAPGREGAKATITLAASALAFAFLDTWMRSS
ncbi:hypothetical protein ABTX35_03515 [Streptomyces sp. NPDC096080]|uniref:hypothetical protein n=1 Tax=Streptomyces sp. NPDC096080 TaxID=3156693 RepID=UPI0033305011